MKLTIERLVGRIRRDLDKIAIVSEADTDCLAAAEMVVYLRDAQQAINLAVDQHAMIRKGHGDIA